MIPKRQILSPEEKKKLIPSKKNGGDLSSIYPTKMKGCGCGKK